MTVHDSDVSLPSTGSAQDARSPASSVLSRRCDSLTAVSLHFVSFDPRYHRRPRLAFRSRCRRGAWVHRAWSLVTRPLPPGSSTMEKSGPPKFPESLLCPFAHARATPAGQTSLTLNETSMLPPLIQRRRLQRSYYRGSVAWLPNSLSTLRGVGYPDPTQDSLPAAGRACRSGLSPAKAPL